MSENRLDLNAILGAMILSVFPIARIACFLNVSSYLLLLLIDISLLYNLYS